MGIVLQLQGAGSEVHALAYGDCELYAINIVTRKLAIDR
jgi:hypothetical protein